MRFIKHLTTWLLLLTVLTASGLVSAKVASGSQNLSGGLHQENVTANALMHQAKIGFSYDDASGSPVATKRIPKIKPGSAGGDTAFQKFPKSIKDAAKAENPTSTCVFCRREGTGTQVDHAIPRSRGGNATLDNAQLACPHCNASKGARNFPKTPPAGYRGPWPPPWKP